MTVIADSVNPINLTRDAWKKIAIETKSPYIEVEIICSDISEYRKRIESGKSDISNFKLPTWADVQDRTYEK